MQNRAQYVAYASDAKRVSRALCCCVKPPLPRRPVKRVIRAVEREATANCGVGGCNEALVHVDICPFADPILIEGFEMKISADRANPVAAKKGDPFFVKVFALNDATTSVVEDIGNANGSSLGQAKGTLKGEEGRNFARLDTPVFVAPHTRVGLLLQLSPGLTHWYTILDQPELVSMDNGSAVMRAISMRNKEGGAGTFGGINKRQSTMSIHYRVRSRNGVAEKAAQAAAAAAPAKHTTHTAVVTNPSFKCNYVEDFVALSDQHCFTGDTDTDPYLLIANLILDPTETVTNAEQQGDSIAHGAVSGYHAVVSAATTVGDDVAHGVTSAISSVGDFFSGL